MRSQDSGCAVLALALPFNTANSFNQRWEAFVWSHTPGSVSVKGTQQGTQQVGPLPSGSLHHRGREDTCKCKTLAGELHALKAVKQGGEKVRGCPCHISVSTSGKAREGLTMR